MSRHQLACPNCRTPVTPAIVQPPPMWYECDRCFERNLRTDLIPHTDLSILKGQGPPRMGPTFYTVNLSSDQTFTSTTPANVTGLSFQLEALAHYHFRFVILYRSNTLTTGLQTSATYPTVSSAGAVGNTNFAADGAAALWTGAMTSSGDGVSATDVAVVGTDYVATIEGVLVPSAAGVLQAQAAIEAAASSGTITVRDGSCGFLTRF